MNIEIIYLHVVAKAEPHAPNPDYYTQFSKRFASTYDQFDAGYPHRLTVVSCGGPMDKFGRDLFTGAQFLEYHGHGWDCGAHQFAAMKSDADFVLCLSTPVYCWRNDWLKPVAVAVQEKGPGLYGLQTSFERNPHVRTSMYAFHPELIRLYPHQVNSRRDAENFESGLWIKERNFTTWTMMNNYKAWLLTADGGCLPPSDWRNPPNIFRRGDQSNCLLWDRHNDIYRESTAEGKRQLEHVTDTLTV